MPGRDLQVGWLIVWVPSAASRSSLPRARKSATIEFSNARTSSGVCRTRSTAPVVKCRHTVLRARSSSAEGSPTRAAHSGFQDRRVQVAS